MNQHLSAKKQVRNLAADGKARNNIAYQALVLFSLVYFVRPEDFIPGLHFIPIAKITGGLALLALLFLVPASSRRPLTVELKVLLLLLVQMLICIPFAVWRMGAVDAVVNKFSKGVIVAILTYMVVSSMLELRKLLAIQAGTVALVTIASVFVHHTEYGRLMGIQKGILENPNDLAINIAINFPLCLGFLFVARGIPRKLFWMICLVFMFWGVIATYSRSGMLATVVTVTVWLWEFGIRGKRTIFLLGSALAGILVLGVVMATPNYLIRLQSLVSGNIAGSGDHGSLEARGELLKDSLKIMVQHPILGIGPGNIPSYTLTWHVSHNTYTELGAEAGVPALVLFLVLLGLTLRKIRRVRELPGYESNPEIRVWSSALWAAMAAYSAGAMFASTEYNLFPYFMVGYVCALYQIASASQPTQETPRADPRNWRSRTLKNTSKSDKELAWTR